MTYRLRNYNINPYKDGPFHDFAEDDVPSLRYPRVQDHGHSQNNPTSIQSTRNCVQFMHFGFTSPDGHQLTANIHYRKTHNI
jgi:hypothetical protein